MQLYPGAHGHCKPSIIRSILQRYPGEIIGLHLRFIQHSPTTQCMLSLHRDRCEREYSSVKLHMHLDQVELSGVRWSGVNKTGVKWNGVGSGGVGCNAVK